MKKTFWTILATVAALSASAATQKTFTDKEVLTIDANTTWYGTTGQSPIDVPSGRTAVINIKKGVTLTVYGADADGTACAVPAIYVPQNATLYITGEGTLVANGGNAANGANGEKGYDASRDGDDHTRGWAGDGGNGGGGAAAGIGGEGGKGADGGEEGYRGSSHDAGDNDDFPGDGAPGDAGGDGASGAPCGSVYILGNVTVKAIGGSAGAAGSPSSWGKNCTQDAQDFWASGGGGSGGGGGGGGRAMAIGGGGGGGGAGGGGGTGSYVVADNEDTYYGNNIIGRQGGNGGGGESGGGGTRTDGHEKTYHANYDSTFGYSASGQGGNGGYGGSQGDGGSLYAMTTATLVLSDGRTPSTMTALSGSGNQVVNTTVTFMSAGSTVGTRTASLAFAPPSAPSPSRSGYVFLGYYTAAEGGTQFYDKNLNCVACTIWPYVENMTLHAHWLRLSNITFRSNGEVVDTITAQQGNATPNAPEATREDYSFLGYFTEETGGTKVYNADRTPVQSTWNSTADVTYYAHWEPVSVPFVVTLVSDGVTVSNVNARQSYAIEPVLVPTKENSNFLGYWTQLYEGDMVFKPDGTPVASTWTRWEDLTLYARWDALHSVTFFSDGATQGTDIYANSSTAKAPIPSRTGDDTFIGYFTEDGEIVFDGTGSPVPGALSWLNYDVTLYARWIPPAGSLAKLVYRGQLTALGTDDPPASDGKYEKTMHFRVYDDESAETPLWKIDNQTVTVNKDGSFVATFGDDTLAELIATGTVTHVGVAIGSSAIELKPRRALRPVAVVNRALVAEGAGKDPRIGNLVTENALAANNVTISRLEVYDTVTAPGAGKVDVSPVVVGERETMTLLRGDGVKVFSKNRIDLGTTDNVQRGQKIGSRAAPSDGIALISSRKEGTRGLRIPGVIQYCRKGDWVRAPASEPDGVKVTFFPFVGKEVR